MASPLIRTGQRLMRPIVLENSKAELGRKATKVYGLGLIPREHSLLRVIGQRKQKMLSTHHWRPKEELMQPLLRREVIPLIETWWLDGEASTATHPLVSVQEGHLSQGKGGQYVKETKPQGRSKPLIRDLKRGSRRTDRIMSHIKIIDRVQYKSLVSYAVTGSYTDVADVIGLSENTARKYVGEGKAVFIAVHQLIY